ncbi:MAG TPA: ATP-grasp domain-containing protein [Candidatus Hydrogenedentes bacterium]|nr:ATP-grasp domain-containing protein [Candidatus Hydrogenedentota bacterium]HPG66204.1 ATP-grasp domain-containing protein [Candidatus Hydrogenedentota bacterium]
MREGRVLVVGTTADYVEIISERFPGRTLFITDPSERASWPGASPDASDEVTCLLDDAGVVLDATMAHVARHGITIAGVTAYDCESLRLAAGLARALGLPFPTADAVARCRSKHASHQAWHAAGVPCPRTAVVSSEADAMRAFAAMAGPVVVKPLTGSGSELVFLCRTEEECLETHRLLETRLAAPRNRRMYAVAESADGRDPTVAYEMESFIDGIEYSCDCLIDGGDVTIIRLARKIPAPDQPLGTILAYVVPAELPDGMPMTRLRTRLAEAAQAVGLERAMAMVDFMVQDADISLLELTPRPGGDCLPWLTRSSCGFDILGAALDFAAGEPVAVPPMAAWRRLVGLRLFAARAGVVSAIDAEALLADPRVEACYLKHDPGHEVILPPLDYDSRILGHAIFEPSGKGDIERQCLDIAAKLNVRFE